MKASREMDSFDMLFLSYLLPQLVFITPSYAQDAANSITPLPEPSTTTPPTPSPTSNSLTTQSALLTTSNPSPYPQTPPLPVYPTSTPTPTPGASPHDANVFNYYFLFLAALALIVIALVWYFHVQRARRKHAQRVSGQHALARDLEGWAGARRFMHGRHRMAERGREEGLDENGEAPPPYQPKSEVGVGVVGGEVAVPLRAIVREGNGDSRPPGYSADGRT